jgi:hypothetical protein
VTCPLRDIDRVRTLSSCRAEGSHQGYVERTGCSQARAGRCVGARDQGARSNRQHAERGLVESQPPIVPEPGRVSHLELIVEILGHEPEAAPTHMHFGLREQSHTGGDDHTTFSRRERRNIGPAAREVESHRCGSPEGRVHIGRRLVSHGATHQS